MPGREIIETATWLAHLGIIEVRKSLIVRCADPLDKDFPPPVRDCDGHITLTPNIDEGGGHYRCPSCEQLVFPSADEKRRYEAITVVLQRSGIEKYLIEALGVPAKGRSFRDGVITLPIDGLNAFVCVVEFCSNRRYLLRGVAAAQPCLYVTVEPDTPARLLPDSAIRYVELVHILTGEACLASRLATLAPSLPAALTNMDLPIFPAAAVAVGYPASPAVQPRRFAVSCDAAGFSVDGLLIVAATRTTAMRILRALVQRFAADLAAGEDIGPTSVEDLADIVQSDEDDARDAESVRRTIDRIRGDITKSVRRESGNPIGSNDVIETVSRTGTLKGARGYRLNPRTVVLAAAR
jgi:hypothetical protein